MFSPLAFVFRFFCSPADGGRCFVKTKNPPGGGTSGLFTLDLSYAPKNPPLCGLDPHPEPELIVMNFSRIPIIYQNHTICQPS
jgi:hypothetical protein